MLLRPAPRTFFGAPTVADLDALDAQVAFLGVPFDAGTPQPGNRTGQAEGPAAARQRSFELLEAGTGFYDVESDRDRLTGVTMADVGDVAIQGADVDACFDRMTEAARRIVERGALLVAVGGDHSISFPLGRGVAAVGALDVVHLDAHADFLDELEGSRATGASQLRRLAELETVRSVTALGLRNVEREEVEGLRAHGARWATSLELERDPAGAVRGTVPRSDALYVSIDLDVLDASLVPGTTLPEPGGPGYRQLRTALAEVARRGCVVALDVAELNPPLDPSGVTARLATSLVAHVLAAIFEAPR